MTISVFILSGAELRATMTLEGPIAPLSITSGAELQHAMDKFTGHEYGEYSIVQDVVDFEHLQTREMAESDDDDDPQLYHRDPSVDDVVGEDVNSEAFKAKIEEKNRISELARARAREHKRKREKMREDIARKVRDEGEPAQRTLKAKAEGWYRACVKGTWYQVRLPNVGFFVATKFSSHYCLDCRRD